MKCISWYVRFYF